LQQAVVLAAGEGQRLRPFTASKPKAMLSLAGKPVLHYVVEALAENGIRDIVLVVGYQREQILDYLGSGEEFGVEISYVTQEKRLGTAHALAQAREKVADEFLVLSGDKLITPATIAQFVTAQPAAVLVKRVDNPARFGVVTLEDETVRAIIEQPREAESNLAATRIYALSREVFRFIEAELAISDVLNKMIAQGERLTAQETGGTWLDIVYPWDVLRLNRVVLRWLDASLGGAIERGVSLKGPVSVGAGTIVRANSTIIGPVVIGSGCDIGPNVCILPDTSIGDNVVLSPFTEIKGSVIGSDVSIGAGSIVQDSVMDRGCVIGGHFAALTGETEVKVEGEYHSVRVGAMLGEGCRIGSGVVAQPGATIGNYSEVRPLRLVSGWLPDKSLVY
jgi:glucose-1-phosphate thymidylyltransferase